MDGRSRSAQLTATKFCRVSLEFHGLFLFHMTQFLVKDKGVRGCDGYEVSKEVSVPLHCLVVR